MLNQRKNKRFNYQSRLNEDEALRSKNNLEAKWGDLKHQSKRRGNILASLPVLIVILALIVFLMYYL